MSLPPVAVLEAIFTRDAGPGGKPVRIDEIAELGGGVSNASYRIASDRGEIVLRCSPTADRNGSAHDMAREHGVLAAVSAIYPACPRPLWTGRDERLNGDYLVMEYREGTAAMRGRLAALSPPDADAFCETFIRQLVDLHNLPSSRLQAALGSETRGSGNARLRAGRGVMLKRNWIARIFGSGCRRGFQFCRPIDRPFFTTTTNSTTCSSISTTHPK